MKTQKTFLFISIFFISLIGFSQQIGNGYATMINNFSVPLTSGAYNNSYGNVIVGITPDVSSTWQHLFTIRHPSSDNNHQLQIASSFTSNDRLFFRKIAADLNPSNPAWFELATRGTNAFNGSQIVNGRIFSSIATPEGGSLSLTNPSKDTQNAAREWILYNMTGGYTNSLQFWAYGDNGYQGGPKMTLSDNGNLGIGTTAPTAKFEITGGGITTTLTNINNTISQRINTSNPAISLGLGYVNSDNPFIQAYNNINLTPSSLILNPFLGKVGIGTQNPDEMLTVNGTVHATKVRVTATVPADYVFQKYYTGKSELKSDYTMPTLAEIESFTKKNNHLPNIPSAKELQTNGVDLGEMNNLLLQKVEELTLYAIEQQKKIEEQNKTIENQSKMLEALATRLTNLEKKQ